MQGPAGGYSWQGWSSSYSASHLDHIIINQSMFTMDATSTSNVISVPVEAGISNNNVDGKISDHQPVMYRFLSLNLFYQNFFFVFIPVPTAVPP